MGQLLKEERQQQILEALRENRRVTVTELSRRFRASPVTIRRDLADLAAEGHIVRAHRGALAVVSAPPEPPVVQRMALEQAAKEQIARAALELVCDGDSIFIGSGSTTSCFARLLACRKKLTVVTNAINIATELAGQESSMAVIVIGGVMRGEELSLLGHIAESSLPEVRVNKIFMGAQALSLEGGWTTDHLPEVATCRRILEMSSKLVILADHSKLGQTAPALITPISRLHALVTDAKADQGFIRQVRARGVRVIVAGEEQSGE